MKKNEFGVYMPEEIREDPNDFYRNKIFNEWFVKQEKFFRTAQNKKYNDVSIKVNLPLLCKIYDDMYKKYCKNYTEKIDCVNDCISYTWEALTKFEPRNMTWEYLANHDDRKTRNKLMSYVRTIVTESMKKMHIKSIETTRTIDTPEGKRKFHVYYELEIRSLNILVNPSHSEFQIELVELMENSFWDSRKDYKYCTFVKWFLDNKEEILNKRQLKFLQKLESANYSILDKDYSLQGMNMEGVNIRSELRKICKSVEKAYKKQNKFITGGFVVEQIDNEIKSLTKMLNSFEKDITECKTEKEIINRIGKDIMKNLSKEYFQKIIYNDLDYDITKQIIKVYGSSMLADEEGFQLLIGSTSLNKKVITHVMNAIYRKVEYLKRRKEEELKILKTLQKTGKKKVRVQYIEPPEDGGKSIFMVLNPYGILIPKQ